MCSEVLVTVRFFRVLRGVSPEGEKEGYGGKDLRKMKVLSRQWKSDEATDAASGESIEEEVFFLHNSSDFYGYL